MRYRQRRTAPSFSPWLRRTCRTRYIHRSIIMVPHGWLACGYSTGLCGPTPRVVGATKTSIVGSNHSGAARSRLLGCSGACGAPCSLWRIVDDVPACITRCLARPTDHPCNVRGGAILVLGAFDFRGRAAVRGQPKPLAVQKRQKRGFCQTVLTTTSKNPRF